MEPANLPNEIFDLIAQKSFLDLSEAEQNLVLEHLSSEEYESLRAGVVTFTTADESLTFEPLEAPEAIEPKMPIWKQIALYPIPVYQVAILVLIFLGILLCVYPSLDAPAKNTSPEVIQAKQKGTPIKDEEYPDSLVFNL